MKFKFPSTLFNDKFLPYVENEWGSGVFILLGSAGSSKSVHEAMKVVYRLMFKRQNVMVLRKVGATLKDSFYAEILKAIDIMDVGKFFTSKVSPLEITCKNGCQVLFRGLDKVDKIKSVTPRSGVINHTIIEEATEITESDFMQLQFRSRGGGDRKTAEEIDSFRADVLRAKTRDELPKAQNLSRDKKPQVEKSITLLLNTIDEKHWIPQRFLFDENGSSLFTLPATPQEPYIFRSDGLYVMHSTHWDNQFLTEEDHLRYESYRFIDKYFYDVYARGLWGVIGDVVWKNVRIADLGELEKTIDTTLIRYGLDWGYYPDPYAFLKVGIDSDKRHVYIFRECGGIRKSNSDIYQEISGIMGFGDVVVCDSSEPKSIDYLRESGIDARGAYKPPHNKRYGIKYLGEYTIFVQYTCTAVAQELRLQQYKKDARGVNLPDPADGGDHYIDALHYSLNNDIFCHTEGRII